jgi:hypothetical protein
VAINANVYKQKAINIARQMAALYSEMREFEAERVAAGITFTEDELTAVVTSSNAVTTFITDNFHLGNFVKGRDVELL